MKMTEAHGRLPKTYDEIFKLALARVPRVRVAAHLRELVK